MRPRLKLSYLIVATLLLVGAVPLFVYGNRLIELNRDALRTKEREYQTAVTRALADEVGLYYSSGGTALDHLGQGIVVLTNGDLSGARINIAEVRGLLAEALRSSDRLLYISIINNQTEAVTAARLTSADVFLQRAIERAFLIGRAGQSTYQPVEIAGRRAAVMLRAEPLRAGGQVVGVIVEVESFLPIQQRLDQMTEDGLDSYLVDERGDLIAAGAAPGQLPAILGQDLSQLEIVRRFLSWHGNPLASETTSYRKPGPGASIAMLGTYAAVPELHWAVIAQRPERQAFASAQTLAHEGYWLMLASLLISLVLGVYLSARLTHPLQLLRVQAQALARRDFLGRIQIKDRTEIGDLARSFNAMAGEIERYVNDLRVAAEKNRQLFFDSIHLLAQAVDQKDPYTRGHSDRVTRYAVILAGRLNLSEEEIEWVRIAAQLHDIGKIGIEDRILKKPGPLSNEEFLLMKQHTVKGANIVRQVEQLRAALPGIELHHEAVNGSGYPYGLHDEQIPLMAKIIAVADTFDALTTERPYQAARDVEEVMAIIVAAAGVRYSPAVVQAFVEAIAAGELKPARSPVAAL